MTEASKHTENRNDYATPDLVHYIQEIVSPEDHRHQQILRRMQQAGLPAIQIGASEGKLLQLLVRGCQAKKAIEIGTLGGYSAFWIAEALQPVPERKLYTLEADAGYARLARESFEEVGISDAISIVVGDANKTLESMTPFGPFDFCFIDADKISYPNYLLWAADHLRPGGIVAADNAYLFGKVHCDPKTAGAEGPAISAMQRFLKILTNRSYFSSCAMIPTGEGLAVGVK
jgi:caffeoyl-CoA O-methyltransferase